MSLLHNNQPRKRQRKREELQMRMSKGHAVILEPAIHGRFDPRTYYAVKKRGRDEHRDRD
jgi:hypothetical protein